MDKELKQKVFDLIDINIQFKSVIAVYLYGSRLYKTETKDSDYDFVVILGDVTETDKIVDDKDSKISLHFVDFTSFTQKLKDHDVVYLPLLYLPENFIFQEGQEMKDFIKNEWNLNYKKLDLGVKKIIELSLGRSQRYFESNKYVSLKNIVHALRNIQTSVQLADKGTIYDFYCANEYTKEILKLDYQTWEEYYEHFKPDYTKHVKELEDIINYKKSQVLKEIYQPKNSLATLEFLKYRSLKDLAKYFSINISKSKEGFYILKSESEDSIIERECCPLALDENLKLLAKAPSLREFDFKTLQTDACVFTTSDSFSLVFYYNNQILKWQSYQNFYGHYESNLEHDMFYLYDDRYGLISKTDKNTLKVEYDFEKLPKVFVKDPKESKELIYDDNNWNCYFVQDISSNIHFFAHPLRKVYNNLQNDPSLEEDSLLEILKSRYTQNIFYDDLHFAKCNTIKKKMNKLNEICEKELYEARDLSELEFETFCKESPIGGLIKAKKNGDEKRFLIDLDIATYKEYLNYKPKKQYFKLDEEKMKEWKKMRLNENIPKEILGMIFAYLDDYTIRLLTISSKQFSWIPSNSSQAQEYLKNMEIVLPFLLKMTPYYNTKEFQFFSRLLPFQNVFQEFNLYQHLYLLKPRDLNHYEKENFQVKSIPSSKNIVSYSKFLKNIEEMYDFSSWKDKINWDVFEFSGSSILKPLLDIKEKQHEPVVTLYYTGFNSNFNQYLNSIMRSLQIRGYADNYTGNTFTTSFNSIKLNKSIHFRFYKSSASFSETNQNYLCKMGYDVQQVSFNGKDVICTYSFIQAINTGTFISYPKDFFDQNDVDFYQDLGFNLIYLQKNETKDKRNRLKAKYDNGANIVDKERFCYKICNKFKQLE